MFYVVVGRWQLFDDAYKKAVSTIRDERSNAIDEEQRLSFKRKSNVKPGTITKKPKPSSWTQKFVCLAYTDDNRVPTTASHRELLMLAGLGEKKIQIPDVDCSTDEFHEVLVNSFPKLKNCGGFELLRCIPSTRDLELIPSPSCYSPRLLRNRIGTARIYIRPIQAHLGLHVDKDMKVKDVSLVTLL